MTATFTNAADRSTDKPLHVRVVSIIAAAIARAGARRAYRQMLDREDRVLADMGVSRRDIRQALLECGGRP